MRTLILIVFWLAAAAGSANAQAPTVKGVTITHFGTYTATTKSAPAQSGQESPTGTVGTISDWHFEPDSLDVLAKPGTQFGLEFRIDGEPPDDSVTLYLTLIFPPQGIHNPNTGTRMYAAKIAFPNMKIGALCLVGYGFDDAWEIVPGEWTEQIWYQDHMLAERRFTVSKAE
jgi:Domain of unknown function (DUF3859)